MLQYWEIETTTYIYWMGLTSELMTIVQAFTPHLSWCAMSTSGYMGFNVSKEVYNDHDNNIVFLFIQK